MKRYYKEDENGNKLWLGNILTFNGKQIINPRKEDILSAGYIEYVAPNVTYSEDQKLERIKNGVIKQIEFYDSSTNVNSCIINYKGATICYWADKYTRNSLKQSVTDYINNGYSEYRLDIRDANISIIIPCKTLLQMLSSLEVYAIQCYNKTTDHIYNVNALTSIDEVTNYNFKSGYPEKLIFTI